MKKNKAQSLNMFSKVGIFAGSFLVTALAVYFYSPVIRTNATSSYNTTDQQELQVGIFVTPYIGISLDKEEVDISALPDSFASGNVNVYVATNSYLGHTLTIEDADANTSMMHDNPSVTTQIRSNYEGTKTSSTMEVENWGFSLNATDFYSMPPNGISTLINKTNAASPENPGYDTKTVSFGAKVGMDTISGTYTDVVIFTAYVNTQDGLFYIEENGEDVRVPIYTLGGTTANMQNFDCERVPMGQIVNTTDLRDSNVYSVGRLADGKCWMRQNLRLTNYTLTPEDSNVAENFVLKASDMSGFELSQEDLDANVMNDAVYYLDGNNGAYYSWYAATAGSIEAYNDEVNGSFIGTLQYSVCPKGWHMPDYEDYENLFYIVDPTQLSSGGGSVVERSGVSYPYISLDYTLLNLYLSGFLQNGIFNEVGEAGLIWMPDTYYYKESPYMLETYKLNIVGGEDGFATLQGKDENYGVGLPVRCVTGSTINKYQRVEEGGSF